MRPTPGILLSRLRKTAGALWKGVPFRFQYRINPLSQYNTRNERIAARFSRVIDVWHPRGGSRPLILRWLVSTWCNYDCPYCGQDHSRSAGTHAFDFRGLSEWVERFDHHFEGARLVLVLTGGEPLIDARNMPVFLRELSGRSYVESIRVDTNASFSPGKYADLDKEKLWLMCTFHPAMIEEEKFIEKIRLLIQEGFKIGMVNYVMYGDQIDKFEDRVEIFAGMGVPLHPNPLWDSRGKYSPEALSLLQFYLDPLDFHYRGGGKTSGKWCLFPSVGYEMDQRGSIMVGCHPYARGSFFSDRLPRLPVGPVRCPMKSCKCLDKYSFLEEFDRNVGLNPFEIYHDILNSRHAVRNTK